MSFVKGGKDGLAKTERCKKSKEVRTRIDCLS